MNDYDKMFKRIGNTFDFILVASERVREIRRERKLKETQLSLIPGAQTDRYFVEQRKQDIPTVQAFHEIEDGQIGREYLEKVRKRNVVKRR
jgi:DNA-directed RNA polymerase omega subunit